MLPSVCWTARNDVHGFNGIPQNLSTVDECQAACINDSRCVAIDWEPSNAGKTCWILTSTITTNTSQRGVITNYQLDRTCPSESYFYNYNTHRLLLDSNRVAYLNEMFTAGVQWGKNAGNGVRSTFFPGDDASPLYLC